MLLFGYYILFNNWYGFRLCGADRAFRSLWTFWVYIFELWMRSNCNQWIVLIY